MKGNIEFKPFKPNNELQTDFASSSGIAADVDTTLNNVSSSVFSQTAVIGTTSEGQK